MISRWSGAPAAPLDGHMVAAASLSKRGRGGNAGREGYGNPGLQPGASILSWAGYAAAAFASLSAANRPIQVSKAAIQPSRNLPVSSLVTESSSSIRPGLVTK